MASTPANEHLYRNLNRDHIFLREILTAAMQRIGSGLRYREKLNPPKKGPLQDFLTGPLRVKGGLNVGDV